MRALVFLSLVVLVGCKSKENPTKPSIAVQLNGVQETINSAQALGSAAVAESQTKITGKLHSEGGTLGNFDVDLTACKSGEVNGFFGVDFFATGSDDLRLRYVHDEAKGEIVKVAYPTNVKKDTVQVLDPAACKVIEGNVEKTNFQTWTPKGNIRHVNGHVKFDCAADGKGHVTGEATFSHCH